MTWAIAFSKATPASAIGAGSSLSGFCGRYCAEVICTSSKVRMDGLPSPDVFADLQLSLARSAELKKHSVGLGSDRIKAGVELIAQAGESA